MLTIDVCDNQETLIIDADRLRQAAEAVLVDAGVREGVLSIAVVDDPTIHQLNRQFLDHDYATDVLSFVLEREGERLEGEVIVSADTAQRSAGQFGWPAEAELLLYVIHGTLHLVGHDDHEPEAREAMRAAERRYLARLGLEQPQTPLGAGPDDER